MRRAVLLLIGLSLVLAGCLDGSKPLADNATSGEPGPDEGLTPGERNGSDEEGPDGSNGSDAERDPGDGSTGEPDDRTSSDNRTDNGTPPPRPPSEQPPWPPLGQASVRPGVRVVAAGSQCTSNFVFHSPDNTTLYLGLAAHCVTGIEPGDAVSIAGGEATGTLVYSSWRAMGHNQDASPTATHECEREDSDLICTFNDFALIAIDPADRGKVHPATLHFGGPSGLAVLADQDTGSKVLTYGNSGLRAGVEPTNWHEGYVVDKDGKWSATVYNTNPGIQGDSGSGVLTGDGEAVGVLVTVHIFPTAGANGVTSLAAAVDYMEAHGGPRVELATWQLIDGGLLP